MQENSPHKNRVRQRSPRTHYSPSKAMAQKKSLLNCIVDDSALLAGIKDATKNSLVAWIDHSLINIFVPLYTLEKLSSLRSGYPPKSEEAQAVLEWLDNITSKTESKKCGRVQLQGPDDQYQTWDEVERYLLPDTPLAYHGTTLCADALSEGIDEKLALTDIANEHSLTSRMAPLSKPDSIKDSLRGSNVQNSSHEFPVNREPVEDRVEMFTWSSAQALLNYVVWRTHHEENTQVGFGKYLLLTNDPKTQAQAKKFGIRAKSVDQLRHVLARDTANLPTIPKSSEQALPSNQNDGVDEEDADEVVFSPTHRPSSSRSSSTPNVWDPDYFGRKQSLTPQSNNRHSADFPKQANAEAFRGKQRGGSRGNPANQFRGPRIPPAGRQPRAQQHTRPIDPDSFARPTSIGRGRGRGAVRRLWEPN